MTEHDRQRLAGLLTAVDPQQQAGETLAPERVQSRSSAADKASNETEVALRPFAAMAT